MNQSHPLPTKATDTILSKRFQQLFIGIAATTYVLQLVYWGHLLRIVYPGGRHLSGVIIVPIWTAMLLPALLFIIAYVINNRQKQQANRVFEAVFLTVIGLVLQQLITILLDGFAPYNTVPTSPSVIYWQPAILALTYCGIAVYTRKATSAWSLQRLVMSVAGVTVAVIFVVNTFTFARQLGGPGLHHLSDLLFSPLLIQPVVLPVLFFIMTYAILAKKEARHVRLFVAIAGALLGTVLAEAVGLLYGFSHYISDLAIYLNTTMVVCFVSLAVYAAVLWAIRSGQK